MTSPINSFIEKVTSKNHLVFIFLFGITLFAYGNILFGNFVFDDNIFIQNNAQIRSLGNVHEIYSSSTTAGSGLLGDNFYRPNQQFIYAVIYSLGGLTPFFFHFFPILFHVLNGFLIFILFAKLGISRRFAFFGSLLFLLHPILTEAVSYISGLSDPLVTSTILLTLLIFLESIKDISQKKYLQWLSLGALVFTVGLFSKENQIISLGLIVVLAIFQYKKGQISNFFRVIIFAGVLSIIASLYVYARLTILNFTGVIGLSGGIDPYTQNLWIRLSTFIHILPEYFKMMIFPWHLNYEKPYVAYDSLLSIQSILSLLIIITGVLFSLKSIIKRNGEIFLGLSWFMIALVPVSGIIPVNAMYLEHWLYLAIIGIIFCLCFLFDSWFEKLSDSSKKVAFRCSFYFIGGILILFIIRIMMRNVEWGDPVKFYQNEIRYTQYSARIYTDLGIELSDRGDCQSAIPNYEKAISLNDSYPQTHHNLARCFISMGKLQDAANEYLKALYLEPNFSYSLNGLYDLLQTVGDKRSENLFKLQSEMENGRSITRQDIENALLLKK